MTTTQAKEGSKVHVIYVGTLDSGEVFDQSKEPLVFSIGTGQVILGFEHGVIGMNINDTKDIVILPKDGYGEPIAQMILQIPKEKLEGEPQIGMHIGMQNQEGQSFQGLITEVTDDQLTVDFNHPLAGKTLHFKMTLVKIE